MKKEATTSKNGPKDNKPTTLQFPERTEQYRTSRNNFSADEVPKRSDRSRGDGSAKQEFTQRQDHRWKTSRTPKGEHQGEHYMQPKTEERYSQRPYNQRPYNQKPKTSEAKDRTFRKPDVSHSNLSSHLTGTDSSVSKRRTKKPTPSSTSRSEKGDRTNEIAPGRDSEILQTGSETKILIKETNSIRPPPGFKPLT